MARKEHSLARCCWCGSKFVWSTVKGTWVWLCPTEACWRRQVNHHLAVSVKGGPERCLYVPLPRQVELIEATAKRVRFGGAAGGSKSHGLRWLAWLFALRHKEVRVLILRRTFKDLERTHMRDADLECPTFGAVFTPTSKLVRFPNGSVVEFGHCEDKAAASNYLSAEYDLILPDELVTFERDMILLIASRARTTKPGVVPRVIAATNPGGPQSAWVRQFYIDKSVDKQEFPYYAPDDYAYIPSKLEDNPYLNEDYEQSLLGLPAELRRAYREGDWDIFPGQFFPEFRRTTHVSAAHVEYPREYPRIRAIDWGFVKPGICGWFVMLPDGHAYLEDEYVFTRTIASEVAKEIDRRTKERGVRVKYTVADTGMWTPDSQTGETIADTFTRFHVPLIQADKDRVNGWQRLRHWYAQSPTGQPWLTVSGDRCPYTVRTIPSMVSDDTKPEDIDSDGEDHAADMKRYWAMSRPMPGSTKRDAEVRPGTYGWYKRQGQRQNLGILAR